MSDEPQRREARRWARRLLNETRYEQHRVAEALKALAWSGLVEIRDAERRLRELEPSRSRESAGELGEGHHFGVQQECIQVLFREERLPGPLGVHRPDLRAAPDAREG
jgi:hypothetical protein